MLNAFHLLGDVDTDDVQTIAENKIAAINAQSQPKPKPAAQEKPKPRSPQNVGSYNGRTGHGRGKHGGSGYNGGDLGNSYNGNPWYNGERGNSYNGNPRYNGDRGNSGYNGNHGNSRYNGGRDGHVGAPRRDSGYNGIVDGYNNGSGQRGNSRNGDRGYYWGPRNFRDGTRADANGIATSQEVLTQEAEEVAKPEDKSLIPEKLDDAPISDKPVSNVKNDSNKVVANEAQKEEPVEEKVFTLEEYYKTVYEEKRKALVANKPEERKVNVDKEFESMKQLSLKKGNDEIFIKLVADKNAGKRKEDNNRNAKEVSNQDKKVKEVVLKTIESWYGSRPRGRGRGGYGGDQGKSRGGYGGDSLQAGAGVNGDRPQSRGGYTGDRAQSKQGYGGDRAQSRGGYMGSGGRSTRSSETQTKPSSDSPTICKDFPPLSQ